MVTSKYLFVTQNRPGIADWTMPPVSEFDTNRNEFSHDPCPLGINYSLGIEERSIGATTANYGLPNQNTQSHKRSNDGHPFGPFEGCVPIWLAIVCFVGMSSGFVLVILGTRTGLWISSSPCVSLSSGLLIVSGSLIWLTVRKECDGES